MGDLRLGWLVLTACGRLGFDPSATIDAAGPIGNRAFVTSSVHAPGMFGGLAAADAACGDRAREAGLDGRFVAWLSTTTLNAPDRLVGARGWYRMDGAPLADTVTDIVNGGLYLPVQFDERGRDLTLVNNFVATGTFAGVVDVNCGDFTDPSDVINVSLPFFAGGSWTNETLDPCSEPAHLYCLQVDHDVAVAITPATGRRAFVSTAAFVPSTGLAAADAICNGEATSHGMPADFLALLPDTGSAASRFDLTGPPWVRIDGMALGPTAALMAGMPAAPLNVTADGSYIDGYAVTGFHAPSDPPDPSSTCNGWSDPAGGNVLGRPSAGNAVLFSQTHAPCSDTASVYCLER